jgi:hypothetical protein
MPNRSSSRKRIAAFVVVSGFALAAACDVQPATQFTVGVTSQIIVPNDVQSVRIIATAGGNVGFCQTYPVVDGKARLPQSLALAPDKTSDPNSNVTISVMGFTVNQARVLADPTFDQCTIPTVSPSDSATDDINADGNNSPQARVLRRSILPYVASRNLYVPMPLRYSCYGVNCSGDQTCKGGVCTSSLVDPKLLPDFDPVLLAGNTSTCFDSNKCLGDAVGPDVVDAATCTYDVPTGTSLAEVGMNVRVIYEPYRVEVLDEDANEGFTLPDPQGHPNRFRLAPSLCSGGQGPKIKSIVASRTCPTKNVYQPLCATDATTTTLSPTPSLVYMLVDQDTSMVDYVGTKNAGSTSTDKSGALDDALTLALGDPVFMTTQLAFRFVPTPGSECSAPGYATPDGGVTPFVTVDKGVTQLTQLIGDTLPTPTAGLSVNALFSATGVYALQLPKDPKTNLPIAYNHEAVLLVTNRTLDPSLPSSCAGGGAPAAVAAASAAGWDTYVFSLRNALETPPATQTRIDAATAFATASGAKLTHAEGGASGDPTTAKLQAAQGIGDFVSSLGGCLYDKPNNFTDPAQGTLTLKPAGAFAPVTLPPDATCNATSTTADGWAIDGSHIRVCGAACTTIRTAIAQNQLLTAQRNQTSSSLPGQVLVQLTVP